ncbi:MAG: class I SAM-dependent methyltransferase [Bacteroidales bacterium]|nr:class I SAM-dependent methyltransferase [Bacteroidales bacterium]
MKGKIKVELGDIQKTLFMPVWARAVETKKENPILIDLTALEIIDTVDFDFSQMTDNLAEISQIAWIARCKRFDMIVNDFIDNHPNGTVVNIGCGLDTSYERIYCDSIQWYDLDLPDVIELKKKFQKETDKRKFISSSFLNTNWFDNIVVNDTVLFISTGVFVYFEEPEIRNFVIRVADRFVDSEMFFDVTSPKGLEIANQIIQKSGLDSRSFFKWALTDKSIITSWDKRINLLNTYHTFRMDGLGLNNENKNIALISDSLDIQYMVHLKISKTYLGK